jgi:Tfp pilus assembly protein PilO
MATETKKPTRLAKLAQRLRDPLQFRIFVAAVIVAVGYVGVYMPLDGRITAIKKNIKKTKVNSKLSKQVETLQKQVDRVAKRLPKDTDTNEWLQYVLGGVRKFPVHLHSVDPTGVKDVGPFEAVVVEVSMSGYFDGLDGFLRWVETNDRLLRIDRVGIAPAKGSDELQMKVTILGLRG